MRRQRLQRNCDPAVAPIMHEISRLRRTASHDPDVMAMVDNVEELIAKGWTVRACNANPARVADLRPEWKGSEPPSEPGRK